MIWFMIGLFSVLLADTSLYTGVYPLSFIMYVVFIFSVFKIAYDGKRSKEKSAIQRSDYNRTIDRLSNEISDLTFLLNMKADKLTNNIHTGSKPNIEYYKMLLEKEGYHAVDRKEDQKAQKE